MEPNERELITAAAIARMAGRSTSCKCREALRNAIITSPDKIEAAAKERLKAIIGKYLDRSS